MPEAANRVTPPCYAPAGPRLATDARAVVAAREGRETTRTKLIKAGLLSLVLSLNLAAPIATGSLGDELSA
jgi:hypothetical protein